MSLDIAALYLSVDHSTLLRLALEHRVDAVDVGLDAPRWRKADLDRLARQLPTFSAFPSPQRDPDRRTMSDTEINMLATAVANRLSASEPRKTAELFSIRDTVRILGLSRTTVYRLISEGQLEVRRIGKRTLVTRTALEAIQSGL